jgi:Archaeal fructose-1,6-bisphosphatase and related enzymes of inositol monophosphatase family
VAVALPERAPHPRVQAHPAQGLPGSTGFPFRPGDNFRAYMRMFSEITQRTAGVRRPGAAALDLAYVAAGFTDGFL